MFVFLLSFISGSLPIPHPTAYKPLNKAFAKHYKQNLYFKIVESTFKIRVCLFFLTPRCAALHAVCLLTERHAQNKSLLNAAKY